MEGGGRGEEGCLRPTTGRGMEEGAGISKKKTLQRVTGFTSLKSCTEHVIIIIIIMYIYNMAPNSAPGAPIQPSSTSTAIIIPR